MNLAMRGLARAEDVILALTLAVMAMLPIAESAGRSLLGVGISGAASFTQHLTLVVGMLGAVVAAREQRLLSLSTLGSLLSGRCATLARFYAGVAAVLVATLLLLASIDFVLAERGSGNVIAYGIPVWFGQAVLPMGFALLALRLLLGVSQRWSARIAVLTLAVGLGAGVSRGWLLHDPVFGVAMTGLLLAALLGAPIFSVVGGAALLLFWREGLPLAVVALDHYRLVVSPSLPMIPLFTLVGYLMAESGAPRRLVRLFNALFGGMPGGAAIATVVACAFFTSFSGASGVTIIALGGMLMPLLLGAGYTQRHALGLLGGSGSLGGMLPPGLPLVLYAIVAKVSIDQMFLAGIVPGLLMVTLVALWGLWVAPRVHGGRRRVDWREAGAAVLDAKWELLLPVVAFGALFGGIATPVEAAAVTALYALVVEVFIHRDLHITRDLPRVMAECGLLVGGVLLILGVALGFTSYLVDARIPDRAVDFATGVIESRWAFLVALNLSLLVVGCVLDIFSAIVVLVPLLVPLGAAFGVDPIHLGIILLVNLELGYLTPPVGMNLFFTAYRFAKPLPEVFRAVAPVVAVLAIGVVMVTWLPWLSTALPALAR